MTQQDKVLLINDLCARVPYGVKAQLVTETGYIDIDVDCIILDNIINGDLEIKPYLFPISSMSGRELESLKCRLLTTSRFRFEDEFLDNLYDLNNVVNRHSPIFDWLNEHYFDYRGLIEKGLAIKATNLNIY